VGETIECLFGSAFQKHFRKNLKFFFFEVICFWCFQIILMCWSQKWFLKNKKILLAHFSEWKALWKATTTTLPNTPWIIWLHHCHLLKFNLLNFLGFSSCTTEDASGILTMKVVLVVTILFGATKFLVEGVKKNESNIYE